MASGGFAQTTNKGADVFSRIVRLIIETNTLTGQWEVLLLTRISNILSSNLRHYRLCSFPRESYHQFVYDSVSRLILKCHHAHHLCLARMLSVNC